MQKIYLTSEKLPTRRGNYICRFTTFLGKEEKKTWIVRSFFPETNSWELNETPEAWTPYPPDRNDPRFG